MPTRQVAEIVIAGAGIAGIAAVYQLAVRAGVARVMLVDPREPLSLTSNKGSEAYRNYWPGPDDVMARFMDRSIDLLEALDRDSGQAFELNRRGYAFLTADRIEAERLRQHDGPTASFLDDGRAIHARYPFVTTDVVAMLHVHRAGYMNAVKLGQWLLSQALARGVELVRDEVAGLVVRGHRFEAVRLTSARRIDARAFVLAAGPLLPQWADRLELRMPIVDERHGKICFEDPGGVVPRDVPLLIWNDLVDLDALGTFPPAVHLRPRGAQSLLGIWTYDSQVQQPTFPPAFPPHYAEVVIRGLARMIPGLRTYIGRSYEALVDGGYYCKTLDNRPLIGPTAIEGVYVCGALSGFGIMASQAAADLLSAYLLAQPLPAYASAFHPARFDDPAYHELLARLSPRSGQL